MEFSPHGLACSGPIMVSFWNKWLGGQTRKHATNARPLMPNLHLSLGLPISQSFLFASGKHETRLEGHLVRLLAVSQGEAGFQIAGKEFFVLDRGKDGLVNGLLVGSALRSRLLLLQMGC